MRRVAFGFVFLLASTPCWAGVVARIDNAAQRMTVVVDGVPTFLWPVSTARPGYWTPPGRYRVGRMERMWYSRKYDMAPMPHALFFKGGYATHGTASVGQLGRPASHGCVRLSPGNARTLFNLVEARGGASVIVTGARSASATWGGQPRRRGYWRSGPETEPFFEPDYDLAW